LSLVHFPTPARNTGDLKEIGERQNASATLEKGPIDAESSGN
jgi:hypothetical protein